MKNIVFPQLASVKHLLKTDNKWIKKDIDSLAWIWERLNRFFKWMVYGFLQRYMCFCGTGARGVGRVWGPGFWRLLRLLFGVLSWRFLQIRLLLDQREEHEQDHADHVLTSTTSLIHVSQTERLHIKKALRSKHAKEKQAELELYMSAAS